MAEALDGIAKKRWKNIYAAAKTLGISHTDKGTACPASPSEQSEQGFA